MGNQAIATLEWYLAMGVDELVEETPQNRLIEQKKSEIPEEVTIKNTAPPLKPKSNTIIANTYASPSIALEKATKLADKASTINELRDAIINYKELSICNSATQPVFADGATNAPLMVIGEAPGAQEDKQGIPFCGPSGQLLDKMLATIGMSRSEDTYITNTLFWRPPGNRTPTQEEIAACQPFVQKHIELLKPKVILLLGGVAIRSVLDKQESISRLRGNAHSVQNTQVIASYHPSYLLRQPAQKRLAWQDLLRVKACLKN